MAATAALLTGLLWGCADSTSYLDPCSSHAKAWSPGHCQAQSDGSKAAGDCEVGYYRQGNQCVLDERQCPEGEHYQDDRCVADQLTVDIISQTACTIARNGSTQLIVQFIVRDESGRALDPGLDEQKNATLMTSNLFVDDRPVDVEATISRDSQLLRSDLVLSLVLDASYSMLTHTPPAFEPMKAAAASIVESTQESWQANQSNFDWRLVWFNEYLYEPAANMAGRNWDIDDIAFLPKPQEGRLTGLYKAINYMAGVHHDLYQQGTAASARDQHVMIVLSDGADNHSFFDNRTHQQGGDWNGTLYWTEFGSHPVTQAQLRSTLESSPVPNLRVHVVGFGQAVNEQELTSIATAGEGQYFYGEDATTLERLFTDVQREIATLQTIGVEVPLQSNTYQMSLRVRHQASAAEGRNDFTLTTGDSLSACDS